MENSKSFVRLSVEKVFIFTSFYSVGGRKCFLAISALIGRVLSSVIVNLIQRMRLCCDAVILSVLDVLSNCQLCPFDDSTWSSLSPHINRSVVLLLRSKKTNITLVFLNCDYRKRTKEHDWPT